MYKKYFKCTIRRKEVSEVSPKHSKPKQIFLKYNSGQTTFTCAICGILFDHYFLHFSDGATNCFSVAIYCIFSLQYGRKS